MTTEYPEILTLQQAAGLLQISERTLHRIVKKGEIPGTQVGGQWRFDRDQLKAMVRGEWRPPRTELSGQALLEKESLRLGVELPETLHDLQQSAVRRLAAQAEAEED